jgi:2-polyprenyl-3-methyl-5-hydroxy-6-metoxy-1,4-benzoquinol methylase
MLRIKEENINTQANWDAFYSATPESEHIWNEPGLPEVFAGRFPRDAHVIDLGAGSSIGLRRIAALRPDLKWSAAEQSGSAINHMNATGFPWASLHLLDLNRPLPFTDGQFDVVLCTEVIEHLEHPALAIAEFRRIARKMVAVTCPFENTIDTDYHVWSLGFQDMVEMFSGVKNLEMIQTRGGAILAAFATL